MPRKALAFIVLTGSLLLLAGCMSQDPYYRTDVWRPTGANAANIAAMAADPQDLIRGRGDDRQLSKPAALAVDKVWSGQSAGGGSSAGGSGGGGAAGGTGG